MQTAVSPPLLVAHSSISSVDKAHMAPAPAPVMDTTPQFEFKAPPFEGKKWRFSHKVLSRNSIPVYMEVWDIRFMQTLHYYSQKGGFMGVFTRCWKACEWQSSIREKVDEILQLVDIKARARGQVVEAEDELKLLLESVFLNVIPPRGVPDVWLTIDPARCGVHIFPV